MVKKHSKFLLALVTLAIFSSGIVHCASDDGFFDKPLPRTPKCDDHKMDVSLYTAGIIVSKEIVNELLDSINKKGTVTIGGHTIADNKALAELVSHLTYQYVENDDCSLKKLGKVSTTVVARELLIRGFIKADQHLGVSERLKDFELVKSIHAKTEGNPLVKKVTAAGAFSVRYAIDTSIESLWNKAFSS